MSRKSASQKIRPIWFCGIAIAFCSLLLNLYFVYSNYSRFVVREVIDGDTLQLNDGRRVRLRSIDAPEESRCMASEARKTLTDVVLNRHISLKDTMTDSYGRILAVVYLRKTNVNELMLNFGHARYFSSGTSYDPLLKAAADLAKSKKLGIYSVLCRSSTPKNTCDIKGNIRGGEKTYYLPGCRDYDQVVVDEAYGDVWFCSESEAKMKEFAISKRC